VEALDRALAQCPDAVLSPDRDRAADRLPVRILGPEEATRAHDAGADRIERRASRNWGTVGVSPNIIEASWEALVDSIELQTPRGRKAGAASGEGPAGAPAGGEATLIEMEEEL